MIELTISDLVYINEAAKCLKNRHFALIDNTIIGLDNMDIYAIKTKLDPTKMSNVCLVPLVFDQRELSKFIKSITTESKFVVDTMNPNNVFHTTVGAVELNINIDAMLNKNIYSRLNYIEEIEHKMNMFSKVEEEVTSDLLQLYSMRKTDGTIHYRFKNRYYMTLFSGLLPLNKNDKIYLRVCDGQMPHTFIANFKVKKPKFLVSIYIPYLNVF